MSGQEYLESCAGLERAFSGLKLMRDNPEQLTLEKLSAALEDVAMYLAFIHPLLESRNIDPKYWEITSQELDRFKAELSGGLTFVDVAHENLPILTGALNVFLSAATP